MYFIRDYSENMYFIRAYVEIFRAYVDSNARAIRTKILLETRNKYTKACKTFQRKCEHKGPVRGETEEVRVWVLVLLQNGAAVTANPTMPVTYEGHCAISLYSYRVIIRKYLRCR